MEFEWHEAKRTGNIRKHGVDFIDVFAAFEDKDRIIMEDNRHEYGEVRYNMLAKIHGRIFNVTYTDRGGVIWLISARKANKREQKRYAKG